MIYKWIQETSLLITGGRFAQIFDPFQGLKVPEFPVVDFDAVVNKKIAHHYG